MKDANTGDDGEKEEVKMMVMARCSDRRYEDGIEGGGSSKR